MEEITSEQRALRLLTANRTALLGWYEEQIEKRGKSLAEMFLKLRDDKEKPFLARHQSFEEYCLDRWNMTTRRLQQVTAAETIRTLLMDALPEIRDETSKLKERHLREISSAPEEKRVEILQAVVETPGKITADKIKRIKATVIDGQTGKKESIRDVFPKSKLIRVCPHCGGDL